MTERIHAEIRPSLTKSSCTGGKWVGRATFYRNGESYGGGDISGYHWGMADAEADLRDKLEEFRRELVEGGATVVIRPIRRPSGTRRPKP